MIWSKLKSFLIKLWKIILKTWKATPFLEFLIGFVFFALFILIYASIRILLNKDFTCPVKVPLQQETLTWFNKLCASVDSGKNVFSIGTVIERIGFSIGGFFALLLALASFQRVKVLDEIAKAQDRTAREQEKGNFEERYKNAINQLRHKTASIRLGGVYGLYHLARDNKKYSSTICDLLCGYVRELTNSIVVEEKAPKVEVNKKYKDRYPDKPSNEVQSILDILTNKIDEQGIPFASKRIDLSEAYLKGAKLMAACLKGAQLRGVHLEGAKLESVHLEGAKLESVHLEGAQLRGAHLEGANLERAHLEGAKLESVHLEGAKLESVHLEGAELNWAHLEVAKLESVHLEGAELKGAHLEGAELKGAHLEGAELRGAHLEGAELRGAHLEGAKLEDAHLEGAELDWAHLEGAELRGAHLEGAKLEYAHLEGADLKGADFRGASSERIESSFMMAINVLIKGIDELKDRAGKKSKFETTIFSGGVTKLGLGKFKKRRKELEKKLGKIFNNEDKITRFKSKMNDVQKALKDNVNEKTSHKIPRQYAKTIKRGIFPKKEANKIIKHLKEVEKRVEKIDKLYKR